MTEYKISFVSMPDLKLGDGHTQFMIDASDASKVNAFLKSVTKIIHDYMTANDYTATGTKEQWEEIHKKAVAEKEKDREMTHSAKDPPALSDESKQFRQDEIFREALQKEGAAKIIFRPQEVAAETEHAISFRLRDGTSLSIPKDHIRMEKKRYAAVLLPGRDYAVFRDGVLQGKGRAPEIASTQVKGIDLINGLLDVKKPDAGLVPEGIIPDRDKKQAGELLQSKALQSKINR